MRRFIYSLDDLSGWARVVIAICLMAIAAVFTVALFLIFQNPPSSSNTPSPTHTEIAQRPLTIQTEILPTVTDTPSPTITDTVKPPDTPTVLPTAPTDTPTLEATQTPEATHTATVTPSLTLTLRATATNPPPITIAAFVPSATPKCQPSADSGWVQHTVQAGETLFAFQLGTHSAVTVDEIMQVNCLEDRLIYENQVLWLPSGAAENAPSSDLAPTALPADPNAPPPPVGLSRTPKCPCELTVRAGWRLEQIAEVIDSIPVGFSGADFMRVAGRGAVLPNRESLRGAPSGASLEGYIFPMTYTITNQTDAQAFVTMALDALDAATGSGFWGDAAARDLTPYGAVTLASIIVRESGSYNQQVLISSVFHNRLNSGRGLGATVTVQYALGRAGNWWGDVSGYVSTYDSPYNTNLYRGLPPSPIASPSIDALRAAVYPADTRYLYFTAACNGSGNAYAETYEQHLANVNCE